MEYHQKVDLLKNVFECVAEAVEMDSEDSDKADALTGLVGMCQKIISTPVPRKRKAMWVKVWREKKAENGSFVFLTKDLLLHDKEGYKNYLRMTESQFNLLLSYIEQDLVKQDTQMRDAITPAEKLCLTLRFLATGETYQSLSFHSKLSKSAISGIIPVVCDSIWRRLKGLHMKFPNSPSEWESIAYEFAIKWQFPNCIGALDGKHITFRPRRKDGAFYHNYKGTNSIVLLALVDVNCKFIFVDIGCNGCNNDAGVFLQSKLSTFLREERGIPKNATIGNNRSLPFVVVSDDAFPTQKHLMKPYPYHSNCRDKQVFNSRLSRARHVVEHAFGILANRFRIFLAPMNLKVETVENVTFACCVLHNFLTSNSTLSNVNNGRAERVTAASSQYNPRRGEAEAIRQEFMAYFNNEGRLNWSQNV
ncbi:PREDICTED: uncharacterized protein LOC108360141 isoform X2 [Rhagoletis zephyria]|nr:PREDICTED: uncharacterized protein LOC108360141 isoform X2 [Rhagoletis zephyria]XP_017467819.1 PREDICTED: uncharacterized protein LOC108360141 isoform X2 [Rhagoletis zephyria]